MLLRVTVSIAMMVQDAPPSVDYPYRPPRLDETLYQAALPEGPPLGAQEVPETADAGRRSSSKKGASGQPRAGELRSARRGR